MTTEKKRHHSVSELKYCDYFPNTIDKASADEWYRVFSETTPAIEQQKIVLFGKECNENRYVAYYASDKKDYKYSGTTRKNNGWPVEVSMLADIAGKVTGKTYCRALVNYYKDGSNSIGKHADLDGKNSSIASFSFYQDPTVKGLRSFCILDSKTDKLVSRIVLEHGSLFEMQDHFQQTYKHEVRKELKVKTGRVNVTLREAL